MQTQIWLMLIFDCVSHIRVPRIIWYAPSERKTRKQTWILFLVSYREMDLKHQDVGVLWVSRGHFHQGKLSLQKKHPDTMSPWAGVMDHLISLFRIAWLRNRANMDRWWGGWGSQETELVKTKAEVKWLSGCHSLFIWQTFVECPPFAMWCPRCQDPVCAAGNKPII